MPHESASFKTDSPTDMQAHLPETKSFDPYQEWLDIAPAEQPVDYYRLLGVKQFENDADLIREQADSQMAKIRQFQYGKYSRTAQRILNELSAAKSCILNSRLYRLYNAKLEKIHNENRLPDLPGPIELLPEEMNPENQVPLEARSATQSEVDPLTPLTRPSIWPITLLLISAAILLGAVILLFSLG